MQRLTKLVMASIVGVKAALLSLNTNTTKPFYLYMVSPDSPFFQHELQKLFVDNIMVGSSQALALSPLGFPVSKKQFSTPSEKYNIKEPSIYIKFKNPLQHNRTQNDTLSHIVV